MKMIWDLPRSTHTRFVESLSPVPHLEAVLMSRYIGFVENLLGSKKSLVRMIFHFCSSDLSSLTGQNIHFLKDKYEKSTVKELITAKNAVKNTGVYPLQNQEAWKEILIEEIALSNTEELQEILEFVCTEWTKLVVGGMLDLRA